MSVVLDDLDARPGSTTSLLRTVVGACMREQGGWLASATLVRLMAEVDVPAGGTRTALNRVKAKGLLVAEARDGVPGYRLAPEALPMLARGDRRIHQPRWMTDDDGWCLISFSVPEEHRDRRHQLRRRLAWIGCGTVASALWICPAYLADEVRGIVQDLGLADRVTTFLVSDIGAPRQIVQGWWDLADLRARHERFLDGHAGALQVVRADPAPRMAFRVWILALDAWRPIPYLDPGLPPWLLPADWPGRLSIPLFLELRDAVREPAAAFVSTVAAGQAET